MSLNLTRFLSTTVSIITLTTLGWARINLELRQVNPTYRVGDIVSVDVIARSDSNFETIGALDVIAQWDTVYLNPITFTNSRARDSRGPYSWFQSGFINPGTLNNSLADGNAMWTGFGQFLNPFRASTSGDILTTFQFKALRACHVGHPTFVNLPYTLMGYSTAIYSGDEANLNITGTLTGAPIMIHFGSLRPHG